MSKKNRRHLPARTKANPNYQTVIQSGPSAIPVQMPRNMRAYLNEGYRNKTAFRVVGQIARSGAGIKWKHYTDETKQREVQNSELLQLWKQPNSEQGGSKFRENLLGYYCLTGNSYILGINASQNPRAKFDELYCLRPDLTRVHISDQLEVDYYGFGPAYPYKIYQKPSIMHSKLFAGNDDVYGLSPVEVAAMLVDIQKAGQKWNLSLMSNMAAPSGAWVTKQILNDSDYRNLKQEIREKFSGPRNAREPVILHGGVEWQSMSMTPMELDFLSSDEKTDRDIAGIFFNFPVFLLGLADSTFANQAEAKHYLYTDILFPIWDGFVDDLNRWLVPRYGGYLDYDREDVETIQERIQAAKAQASDRATAEFQGGTTTFAEAREIQGKAALPVKDFVLIQGIPVHVADLDDYIAAMAGKTISPPPPLPMLPPPGTTTVTEVPPVTSDGTDGNNSDNPEPDQGANEHADATPEKRVRVLPPLLLPHYITRTKVLDLRTATQKQAYLKTVEARRAKWEIEATTRLQDYFAGEQKTVLAALERTSDTQGAAEVAEHALTVAGQAGTLKHLLVKLYQDVGADSGNQVLGELKSQRGAPAHKDATQQYLNLFGPDVLVYLLQLSSLKVQQITETTRAEIQSALADGVAAGESIPELAKRIEDLYLVEIIPNRSLRIAQTEVVAADNYGSFTAAQQSGLQLRKVFLATDDSHTRPTHADANGQKVGIDEPFDVGGAQMMYPGDSSMGAPANEIVGCRCTQFYERVEAGSEEEEPVKVLAPSRQLPERAVSRDRYRELLRIKS